MQTKSILLVEDEPALRTGTEQFLCQRGFTVLTATSGEEALEKFTQADVIILDIMLPGDYEIGRRRVGKECRSRWSPYH